jgi:hypothetical protein
VVCDVPSLLPVLGFAIRFDRLDDASDDAPEQEQEADGLANVEQGVHQNPSIGLSAGTASKNDKINCMT